LCLVVVAFYYFTPLDINVGVVVELASLLQLAALLVLFRHQFKIFRSATFQGDANDEMTIVQMMACIIGLLVFFDFEKAKPDRGERVIDSLPGWVSLLFLFIGEWTNRLLLQSADKRRFSNCVTKVSLAPSRLVGLEGFWHLKNRGCWALTAFR